MQLRVRQDGMCAESLCSNSVPLRPPPPIPPDVAQLSALTFLELAAVDVCGPQLLLQLVQHLPHLHHLSLSGPTVEQCKHLPCLAGLSALATLELSTRHASVSSILTALLQLLSGGRLRQLAVWMEYGFGRPLPLAALRGLDSLALNTSEMQVTCGLRGSNCVCM